LSSQNLNSPDVSGDVTTNSPDVSDDVITDSFTEEKRKQWINAIKRKEPWTPNAILTCM
jgi:hypothetical protein